MKVIKKSDMRSVRFNNPYDPPYDFMDPTKSMRYMYDNYASTSDDYNIAVNSKTSFRLQSLTNFEGLRHYMWFDATTDKGFVTHRFNMFSPFEKTPYGDSNAFAIIPNGVNGVSARPVWQMQGWAGGYTGKCRTFCFDLDTKAKPSPSNTDYGFYVKDASNSTVIDSRLSQDNLRVLETIHADFRDKKYWDYEIVNGNLTMHNLALNKINRKRVVLRKTFNYPGRDIAFVIASDPYAAYKPTDGGHSTTYAGINYKFSNNTLTLTEFHTTLNLDPLYYRRTFFSNSRPGLLIFVVDVTGLATADKKYVLTARDMSY